MASNREPWAKLIFNPDVLKDPVELRDDRFIIGRSNACSLSLANHADLGPVHCVVEKVEHGRVFLVALRGGIFVNGTERVLKGNRKEIYDGSVISLVRKKNSPEISCTLKLVPASAGTLVNQPPTSTVTVQQSNPVTTDPSLNSEPPPKKCRTDERSSSASSDGSAAPAVAVDIAVSTTATVPAPNSAGPSSSGCSSTRPKDGSGIADNLICSICFEIIHDCISLLPCMHCFCAGCYSEWRDRSNLCPDCRVKVTRMKKNHVLNNVIAAYLAEHPERKRSDEEIKDLDAKNKITPEMLTSPKRKSKKQPADASSDHGSDCECSECESIVLTSSDSDDDDSTPSVVFGMHLPYIPQCRMCVGFRGFPVMNAPVRPLPHARPCPAGQPHVLCQCCFANMPDRRQENNPALPPISCTVCQHIYCNLYLGCPRAGCTGCLARFKDLKFPDVTYNDIINANQYETNILKDYMAKKNKRWPDVLNECVAKMDRNEFLCPDKLVHNLTSESPLCQVCALRNFRELLYQYRLHIPKEDLPAEVTKRQDCYWGRNCRTQRTKPHHAANFNHICEQSKF